jgi:glycosyltransferase involved in cell wall biosynthesis
MATPRVLLLHNRYRVEGGEERSVELQLRAMERAGMEHRLLERCSGETGKARAAAAMLRGGERESEIAKAVRDLGADVAHVHNMHPLIGPRGLVAAREAGARVVLHLHNVRLFCSIAVASRDGGPCFRCHHRLTVPGLVLNCRGSVPEAAVYAAALPMHQPTVFRAVDRFVAPSRYAVRQLALLGVPQDKLGVLAHYLPEDAFAPHGGDGGYALVAGRLSQEKGIDVAIEAAALAGVPLRIAGEGPAEHDLREIARRRGGQVEFLGRVGRARVRELLTGAAALLLPSRYHEFSPYAVLEAMGASVPVVATRMGGVPELIGAERCVPANDPGALAARLSALWTDPGLRRAEGEALAQRARELHSEERFTRELLALYRLRN